MELSEKGYLSLSTSERDVINRIVDFYNLIVISDRNALALNREDFVSRFKHFRSSINDLRVYGAYGVNEFGLGKSEPGGGF